MKSVLKFLRDWTLPVSMLFGTLMYLLFAYTPALEEAAVFFDPIFELILPWFMFLVLFVTFCKVDFHKMRPVAWHGWNILVQLLTVALIVAVILYFHLQGNDLILMESALTCVIAPCATAAAVVGVGAFVYEPEVEVDAPDLRDELHEGLELPHEEVGRRRRRARTAARES